MKIQIEVLNLLKSRHPQWMSISEISEALYYQRVPKWISFLDGWLTRLIFQPYSSLFVPLRVLDMAGFLQARLREDTNQRKTREYRFVK